PPPERATQALASARQRFLQKRTSLHKRKLEQLVRVVAGALPNRRALSEAERNGVEQPDQSHLLAEPLELVGHLEGHHASEAQTGNQIRRVWLDAAHLLDIQARHVLDARERDIVAIDARGLQAVDGPLRGQVANQVAVTEQIPARFVDQEEGDVRALRLERHEYVPSGAAAIVAQ